MHELIQMQNVGQYLVCSISLIPQGYDSSTTYIATQIPLTSTVKDFWEMIWQTKSTVIIMIHTPPGIDAVSAILAMLYPSNFCYSDCVYTNHWNGDLTRL